MTQVPPGAALSDEDMPALAARYRAGATLHDLKALTGVPPKTMARKLRDAGLELRRAGRPKGRKDTAPRARRG